jgi:hypothetical protein
VNRLNFYNIETHSNVDELDFLYNSLSTFDPKYPPVRYRLRGVDWMRPDLISYNAYGTVQFWWIILLQNNISNPFTEMTEGSIIEIPNKLDIFEFQKQYRLRRSLR